MKNNNEMKIIYVVKDKLHRFPPCISQVVMLCNLGCSVYVIAEECGDSAVKIMENAGATVSVLGKLNIKKGLYGKLYHWLAFFRKASKKIKEIYNDKDVLWCGTEGTAIALERLLKNRNYVLTTLELFEIPFYKKGVGRVIKDALAVVACEKNRARIMKRWYGLKKIPFIMPNKPGYELDKEMSDEIIEFKKTFDGKKYILYQGMIEEDRSLKGLAYALNKTKERYKLVIIGHSASGKTNDFIAELKSIYTDTYYGGSIQAPQHLHITEGAHIGVAFYDDSSLNNLFCAPNKIFEYSKYNIPIIGNDIPGLQCSVEVKKAGICVDMENPCEIAAAIDRIEREYSFYQEGAKNLYESTDNLKTMKKIVEEIGFI